MSKPHLVIIGNGMASGRLLEEVLRHDPEQYQISVFGEERYGNYNRIMLSPVLAGEMKPEEIMLNTIEWYRKNGITLFSGDPVVRIDAQQQKVFSLKGLEIEYDKLVLATGSSPIIPPVAQNTGLAGILSFRTLDDVEQILSEASTAKHAVVLGGGLLGLEAAYGLRKYGIEVTVIHRGKWLLNRQLDETAGELLKQELKSRGINVRLNCEVQEFCGEGSADSRSDHLSAPSEKKAASQDSTPNPKSKLQSVTLTDGSVINTELAVIAIGIAPNKKLAQTSQLDCARGIQVNDQMQSSHHNIYALGECTQFGEDTFGLVAPLWDQARVLADQLNGSTDSRYRVKANATKLKVSGIDLYSAGEFLDSKESDSLVFKDLNRGIYKKLIFRDQLLVGVVLYGAVQDGNWYFDLIQQQQPVRHLSPDLIFGQRYTEQPQTETNFDTNTSEAVTGQFIPTVATNSLAAGVFS